MGFFGRGALGTAVGAYLGYRDTGTVGGAIGGGIAGGLVGGWGVNMLEGWAGGVKGGGFAGGARRGVEFLGNMAQEGYATALQTPGLAPEVANAIKANMLKSSEWTTKWVNRLDKHGTWTNKWGGLALAYMGAKSASSIGSTILSSNQPYQG